MGVGHAVSCHSPGVGEGEREPVSACGRCRGSRFTGKVLRTGYSSGRKRGRDPGRKPGLTTTDAHRMPRKLPQSVQIWGQKHGALAPLGLTGSFPM